MPLTFRKVYGTNPKTGKREVIRREKYQGSGDNKKLISSVDLRKSKKPSTGSVLDNMSFEERKRYFDTGQYDPTSDNIPASGLVNVPTRKPFSVMSPKDKAKTVIGNLSKFSLLGNLLGLPERLLPQAPDINEDYVGNVTTSPFSISPTSKPTGLLSVPTPTDLVQEVREEEVRKKYPTLTDEQVTELAQAEQTIKDELYPEIKTYGTSILPENIAQQIDEQQQMAMNPYAPTQTMARPVDLGLLSGANIGAEYTTMRRPDVTFKLGISPLAPIGGTDYSQTMLDELTKNGLLTGYNAEISRNLPEATLENLFGYKLRDEPAKISGASARLLGYTPSSTGNEVIPYYNLTYGQQLEYQRMLDDLRNKAQQRNTQLNLLGY